MGISKQLISGKCCISLLRERRSRSCCKCFSFCSTGIMEKTFSVYWWYYCCYYFLKCWFKV